MRCVNISIDASDRRLFEEEHFAWEKAQPRQHGALGHIGTPLVMHGPTPECRCHYIGIPEPFLEVLRSKGIPFKDIAPSSME
jgi:hypothetical protein